MMKDLFIASLLDRTDVLRYRSAIYGLLTLLFASKVLTADYVLIDDQLVSHQEAKEWIVDQISLGEQRSDRHILISCVRIADRITEDDEKIVGYLKILAVKRTEFSYLALLALDRSSLDGLKDLYLRCISDEDQPSTLVACDALRSTPLSKAEFQSMIDAYLKLIELNQANLGENRAIDSLPLGAADSLRSFGSVIVHYPAEFAPDSVESRQERFERYADHLNDLTAWWRDNAGLVADQYMDGDWIRIRTDAGKATDCCG